MELSYNEFTGDIPAAIFELPSIHTISLVSNCLYGSFPLTICSAQQLQTLAMDGVGNAESCHHRIFKNIDNLHSYYTTNTIEGSIPQCLFNLSQIRVIHLSGNAIHGSLPHDIVISDTLTALTLSHNNIYGSIPRQIQEKPWKQLDLSFNRLNGELSSHFAAYANGTALHLDVNRLSGEIPSSLHSAPDISLLDGIFECSASQSSVYDDSLPDNDAAKDTYDCGSNNFNDAVYVWLAVTLCLMVVATLIVTNQLYGNRTDV